MTGTAAGGESGLADFLRLRPRLFGIAYRMLGAATEAEDVVQDAWLRWSNTDRTAVREPEAFLVTTVTRLALDALTSARARREKYVGPWLPEPVSTAGDPALGAERDEALGLAVLLLMERLKPRERAAYVLREAFDYPYDRIGEILEIGRDNARQLATRARASLSGPRRAEVGAPEQRRMLTAFVAAARSGDLPRLERLLTEQASVHSDGGGVTRAARRPVLGRPNVVRFLAGIFARKLDPPRTYDLVEANGRAAILIRRGGAVDGVLTVAASAQGVDRVMIVLNPAKLGAFAG